MKVLIAFLAASCLGVSIYIFCQLASLDHKYTAATANPGCASVILTFLLLLLCLVVLCL